MMVLVAALGGSGAVSCLSAIHRLWVTVLATCCLSWEPRKEHFETRRCRRAIGGLGCALDLAARRFGPGGVSVLCRPVDELDQRA